MIQTYQLDPKVNRFLDREISALLGAPSDSLPSILQQHNAFIAGSVLVQLLGRVPFEPKDVDVWVSNTEGPALFAALLSWTGAKVAPGREHRNLDYGRFGKDIKMIITLEARVPLQIIFVPRLEYTLQSFDLNICSLGWTGASLSIGQKNAWRCLTTRWMKINETALEHATPQERARIQERIQKYKQRGFKILDGNELLND